MLSVSQINPTTVQTPSFKAKKVGAKEVQKLLDMTEGYMYAKNHSKEELKERFIREVVSDKENVSFWDGVKAYFKDLTAKNNKK